MSDAFARHPEYTALHPRIHRNPPATLGAPGLCRQVNLWIPNNPRQEDGGVKENHPLSHITFAQRRDAWKRNIDAFIASTFRRISNLDTNFLPMLQQNTYNLLQLPSGARCVYLFTSTLVEEGRGWIPGRIFDRPDQYHATPDADSRPFDPVRDIDSGDIPARFQNVCFIFMWHGLRVQLRFYVHNEYLSISSYIDLSLQPKSGYTPDSEILTDIRTHMQTINTVCNTRYDAMLQAIKDARPWNRNSIEARSRLRPAHQYLYDEFWKKFEHEVFGDITSPQAELPTPRHGLGFVTFDSRGLLLHCPSVDTRFCSQPFHVKERQTLHNSLALNEIFDHDNAVYHADTVLPLLGATNEIEDPRIEYTASRFLDNRAIYITSLGAEHIEAVKASVPMKFLLLARPYHRWQLGRLVDRLFAVGSVRTGALINLRHLVDAGYQLRTLTRDLQEVLARDVSQANYLDLARQFRELSRRTAKLGELCDGGIDYRVERSRYYVQQYKDLEQTFRMKRVEGFQRADEFVRRRLFSTFSMVDRLGVRLERHRRSLESLGQQVQILHHLHTEEEARITQYNILQIQAYGEVALIIPMTYYAAHVWKDMLPHSEYAHPVMLAIFTLILLPRGIGHFLEFHRVKMELASRHAKAPRILPWLRRRERA